MIKVKARNAILDGKNLYKPGDIFDIEKIEADRLVKKGAVSFINETKVVTKNNQKIKESIIESNKKKEKNGLIKKIDLKKKEKQRGKAKKKKK